jgi:hypothetical protein
MDDAKLEIALAKICDSYLDRSGALLGRVRNLAEFLNKEDQIDNLKKEIEKLNKELKKLGA